MAFRQLFFKKKEKKEYQRFDETVIKKKYKSLKFVREIETNPTLKTAQDKLNQLITLRDISIKTALGESAEANCNYLTFLNKLLENGANTKSLITFLKQQDDVKHTYPTALAKHQDDEIVIYTFFTLLNAILIQDETAVNDIVALLKECNKDGNHMGPSLSCKANARTYLTMLTNLVNTNANLDDIEWLLTTANQHGNSKNQSVASGLRKILKEIGQSDFLIDICNQTVEKYIALIHCMQEKGLTKDKAVTLLTQADLPKDKSSKAITKANEIELRKEKLNSVLSENVKYSLENTLSNIQKTSNKSTHSPSIATPVDSDDELSSFVKKY